MSKIGKKPVAITEGVTVAVKDGLLEVKGKGGTLNVPILSGIKVEVKDKELIFTANNHLKQTLSNWGTNNALAKNAIAGVSKEFSKELSVVGIGFKAVVQGTNLVLNLGFSHPINFTIPAGVKIVVDKNLIKISGSDKWLVGEVAANIRALKKPEPYQGKGIRYTAEVVRKKAGKKAAAKAGPATK